MNTLVETLEYLVFITFELIALFLLISAAVEIIRLISGMKKTRNGHLPHGALPNRLCRCWLSVW